MIRLRQLGQWIPRLRSYQKKADSSLRCTVVGRLKKSITNLIAVKGKTDTSMMLLRGNRMGRRNILHGDKRTQNKLQATHRNTAFNSVPSSLGCTNIVSKKASHVLKYAKRWFQEVHPGKRRKNETALRIFCFSKHVEVGM
jgi:hypothetical protein